MAAGGSDDYAYDFGAKMSYTIELRDNGRYGFILPESQVSTVLVFDKQYAKLELYKKNLIKIYVWYEFWNICTALNEKRCFSNY